ncbi:hypothetical protein HDU76_002209 [Blyttiomyces sp. JEL0837]|nr:hypothetical protein HDU76_002209 [Blyttiomyces sp. JEL0837]
MTLKVLTSQEELHELRLVPHINLRAAYLSFKWENSLFWSSWKRTGIVVFSKNNNTWIVFDYDEGSIAVRLAANDQITMTRTMVQIKMENMGSPVFFGCLEFDGVYKVQSFVEAWQSFKRRQSGSS